MGSPRENWRASMVLRCALPFFLNPLRSQSFFGLRCRLAASLPLHAKKRRATDKKQAKASGFWHTINGEWLQAGKNIGTVCGI